MAIGRIPENILEDILSRLDIVGVISGYIPLKRAGRNFRTNCPFHQEKTPSFMVSPDRQIYHCFGCGESGNAFKFVMRYEHLEFPEAVEMLARKAGVILPEARTQDTRVISLIAQLHKLNELATDFYAANLNSQIGTGAKDYLIKRGLKPETISAFKLGLALDKWDALINYLRAKNAPLSLLEKAGLVIAKEDGGYYDRFRNRVIFPVFDIKERVVAFGARVLDNSLPKYLNSPETPLYTKGKHLYGMHLAKEGIVKEDAAVIVEGYLDFILPFQEGLTNVVASSGTALTLDQVRLLKRYTKNVVTVYDGDAAGETATLRSLDIFIEEEMDVRVVSLPKGFDPDSFVRQKGIEEFKEQIKNAENLFDYKLKILKAKHNSAKIEGKRDIALQMLATINKFKNEIMKSEYTKKLAEELKISEASLMSEAKKIKPDKVYAGQDVEVTKPKLNINPTEKLLIKLMMEEKDLIDKIRQSVSPSDFLDERTSKIVSAMFNLVEEGKSIEPHLLMNYLGEEEAGRILCESAMLPEMTAEDKEGIIDDCIKRLKGEKIKLKRQSLHEEIKSAQDSGDSDKLQQLMQEFHTLIKK